MQPGNQGGGHDDGRAPQEAYRCRRAGRPATEPLREQARVGMDARRRDGLARAALLRLLDQPLGTTHLAASCGVPVGAVGNHLRVLLDAGVVARRRSWRNVLPRSARP